MDEQGISFLMGVSDIDARLSDLGVDIVEKDQDGDYKLLIPSDQLTEYEELVSECLRPGYWNEYILGEKVVFTFKHTDGRLERIEYSTDTEASILKLCNQFAEAEFQDVKSMIYGNEWYGSFWSVTGEQKISHLEINEYKFDENTNPFAFNVEGQRDLAPIVKIIDAEILRRFAGQNILVRGIQSGKKRDEITRDEYLVKILETGTDKIFAQSDDDRSYLGDTEADFHAGEYPSFSDKDTIGDIFNLHVYKPGCEDRPQLPIDVLLVYSADDYDAVEYLHQRHKVLVKDAYKIKPGHSRKDSLLGVIVIN